jgi:hypothetical protein
MDRTDANLTAAIDHTAGEISRTDTKASLLLALDGVLVAAVATLGANVPAAALVLVAVGTVALVVAVVLGLLVVRPRLAAPNGVNDRSSFVHWATATEDDIAAGMTEDRRVARVRVLSAIALRKMTFLRWTTDATAVAVVALAAAALITAA